MSSLTFDSAAVQTYINNMQSVINRMASNSASSKTWCITLVSAVIVFATDKNRPDAIWIATVPLLLFAFLDAYYLGLERAYRNLYNVFVDKLIQGNAERKDLFILSLANFDFIKSTAKSLSSLSIWPFYGLIFVMLLVLRSWIF